MSRFDRRHFLKSAAALTALPLPLRHALAIPADRRTGTIRDVEHVVILTQENRSFDHYFGCLKGVRGFGDPRPLALPSGKPVFHQPIAPGVTEAVLPFRLDAARSSAEGIASLDHSWKAQHSLWKNHDAWIPVKTRMTMGHFQREDIPFYYALADAFTICDAYHASVFGPTGPNRLFLFSGTGGTGPEAVENIDDGNWSADSTHDSADFPGFAWTSYAERLEKAGVSWKVYQERDNFGDNPLNYFKAFRGLDPGHPLHQKGRAFVEGPEPDATPKSVGQNLVEAFARDLAAGRLPQVSWIVAPMAASEHPEASPSDGQAFTAGILSALAAHPAIWSKMVFILNYDENDGFFDHMPPPVPALHPEQGAGTVTVKGEMHDHQPLGFGPRVPAIIVSPWSRGGWVNSQLFDHTSVIRFLEARFGVAEPNISAWRRAVSGDLTSAFDFAAADDRPIALPETKDLVARMRRSTALPGPEIPDSQSLPEQERGIRSARPLPYRLAVRADIAKDFTLTLVNSGMAGAWFQAVAAGPAAPGPWSFTVEAGRSLTAGLKGLDPEKGYDITLFGPNGFYRRFQGAGPAPLAVEAEAEGDDLSLTLRNLSEAPVEPEIGSRRVPIAPGETAEFRQNIARNGHWYDLAVSLPGFRQRLAGHVETGKASISDPQIGLL